MHRNFRNSYVWWYAPDKRRPKFARQSMTPPSGYYFVVHDGAYVVNEAGAFLIARNS